MREGVDALPGAQLVERALEIRLLLDNHDDLVADRGAEQQRLRWHLHDLVDDLEIPAAALDRELWLIRLARQPATARVRIARADPLDPRAHPAHPRA